MQQPSSDKLYFIDFFEQYFTAHVKSEQVLDYGCGMGEIVLFARNKGYAFWGVDNYYDDDLPDYDHAHLDPKLKKYVKLLDEDGNCPFEDHSFDYIYSNQVFEHVENLEKVLQELYRVLKPGGIMVHNFPCKELINEAHFAVPFVHQITNKKARNDLLAFYYRLGVGLHRESRTKDEWIENTSGFIDKNCNYRPQAKLLKEFKQYFKIQFLNKEKKLYNAQNKSAMIRHFIHLTPEFFINWLQKYLGSVIIFCVKEN